MNEDEAKAALNVPRETFERLDKFVQLLRETNEHQNLVSASSLEQVWSRHILDSAQLVRFAPAQGDWLDLGTGPGFPGLIVALLTGVNMTLVESRRLRVEFLAEAAQCLGISDRMEILGTRVENVGTHHYDAISARAFAPLERLFALGERFSTNDTIWILPKGRNAQSELEAAAASWQGDFRLEPSVTDAEARIIVASKVRRRASGKQAR